MRVRDHAAVATTAAVLLRPWAGRRVLGFWAGSVLIDADHYLWYCLRERRLDPVAATRYFNDAHPQQHWATRILHTPPALAAVTVLALRNGGCSRSRWVWACMSRSTCTTGGT